MSFTSDCHDLAALLPRLDRAITEGIFSAGETGPGDGLPLSAGALSLLQDIDREARELTAETHGGRVTQPLADVIREWPRHEPHDGDQRPSRAKAWCKAIRDLIEPQKPPRRLRLHCPACHQLYTPEGKPALQLHCWDEDEHLAKPGTWTAECLACGAGWTPPAMPELIRLLTKEEEP